jgi:hypothetical protein
MAAGFSVSGTSEASNNLLTTISNVFFVAAALFGRTQQPSNPVTEKAPMEKAERETVLIVDDEGLRNAIVYLAGRLRSQTASNGKRLWSESNLSRLTSW